jgi:putative flippase GtrA
MLGVVVGGVASFALNKYVAFKDGASPVLPQIGRFAASTLAALVVHASLMWLLVERLHGPLLPAKLLADFLVFTCGNLLVMRLVVFRLRPQ